MRVTPASGGGRHAVAQARIAIAIQPIHFGSTPWRTTEIAVASMKT